MTGWGVVEASFDWTRGGGGGGGGGAEYTSVQL